MACRCRRYAALLRRERRVDRHRTAVLKARGEADKITLKLGPAAETLQTSLESMRFDLAFIDANKTNYATYYEEISKRMTRVWSSSSTTYSGWAG